MRASSIVFRLLVTSLLVSLAACGQTGALYLPDQAADRVADRAQQPAPTPATPSQSDDDESDRSKRKDAANVTDAASRTP